MARLAFACLPLPRSRTRLRRWVSWLRPLGRFLPASLREDLKRDLRRWLNRRHALSRSWSLSAVLAPVGRLLRSIWAVFRPAAPGNDVSQAPNESVLLKLYRPENESCRGGPKESPAAGMHLIGYASAATGVGESVRLCSQAASAVGLPFALHDAAAPGQPPKTNGPSRRANASSTGYAVNLLHVNADQMPVVREAFGPAFFANRYNIGYWHWELPEFPDRWLPSFDLVEEVWVPSRFVQDAISAKSPRPVVRIPHGIGFGVSPDASRAGLNLPRDHFLFLMMFDAHRTRAQEPRGGHRGVPPCVRRLPRRLPGGQGQPR